MPILTLTTDWGLRDPYVASFKGELLGLSAEVTLVDISHEIEHFNIHQAAFILKNAYDKFPEGTVHYIGLSGRASAGKQDNTVNYLIVSDGKYSFIGFDTGIFNLILGDRYNTIHRLPIEANMGKQMIHQLLLKYITNLLEGKKPSELGSVHPYFIQSFFTHPTVDSNSLQGTVLFLDSFGNAIVNIDRNLFEKERKGRKFTIYLRKSQYDIHHISESYEDSPVGEIVAIFNREDNLEIALNRASAGGMLGIKLMDPIRIEFGE